jgi:ERCC4-type nuclease
MTKDKYNWILDTRESNPVFVEMADNEGWVRKRLVLSDFIHLTDGVEDMDVADYTNENADGLVEFKTFGDLINSTTGDGVHHLHEQIVKMYATGLPLAVVVYGSRWLFQKQSKVSDEVVLRGIQKATSLAAVYHVTLIMELKDENEAIEAAKTFIRKCVELPQRLPVYNLLKKSEDEGLAMLCGINKIGPKTADACLTKWETPAEFFHRIWLAVDKVGEVLGAESIHDETPGLGNANAKRIVAALYRKYKGSQ